MPAGWIFGCVAGFAGSSPGFAESGTGSNAAANSATIGTTSLSEAKTSGDGDESGFGESPPRCGEDFLAGGGAAFPTRAAARFSAPAG